MAMLLLFLTCTSHAAELHVQTLDFVGKNASGQTLAKGQVKLPYVVAIQAADEKVARNINDRLFIEQFNALAPRPLNAAVGAANGLVIDGTASQSFKIMRNDGRVLSITLDAEGCGAYCEGYQSSHSFDAATGQLLTAYQLFSPAGQRAISQRMGLHASQLYKKQLRALAKESKTTTEDVEDRIALNESCLQQALETKRTPLADNAFNLRIELSNHHLLLERGRCSNHAMRSLDDVGDITLVLPYQDVAQHLSAYGKALLLDATSNPLNTSSLPAEPLFGQLLRGNIGEVAITMLVKKDNNNVIRGHYYYDKYGKSIELQGSQRGQSIELVETPENPNGEAKPAADMKLTRSGNQLTGQWISRTKLKTQVVRLTP
ncbi:MAG: hypothetical protein H7Z77_05240 [Chitinophagaceae bacterium]|nr:hypothetical protein [Polaromonas sp.]